jgi:hypothetical protein
VGSTASRTDYRPWAADVLIQVHSPLAMPAYDVVWALLPTSNRHSP